MAKTGPKPQPTELKRLRGNPGRRPLPKNEPKPRVSSGLPRAPTYLDKKAQNEWRRMVKELHPIGLLTNIDLTALSAYCSSYSIWVDAITKIQKHGPLIKAQSGFPMQSPYLQIANKAQGEMRKWLIEFGMTPSSRTRVKPEKSGDKKDPLKEFQKKGKKLEAVK